jgi:LmbE family N-acetylglucosaminyl deacetylase
VSSPAELGRLRRDELRAACEILGIGAVELGGHPDGLLSKTDLDLVIGEIVSLLRRERPDIVVTFGPEGAPTQHRDHRAISRLATAAYLLAGTTSAYPEQLVGGVEPHRAARLCYVTWPTPAPDSLYQTEGQPIHVRLDARPWNARKREAFRAHTTQQQHRENFERYAVADTECYFIATGTPVAHEVDEPFSGI